MMIPNDDSRLANFNEALRLEREVINSMDELVLEIAPTLDPVTLTRFETWISKLEQSNLKLIKGINSVVKY